MQIKPTHADNCRPLDHYRAYSDAEFRRLCEVQRQLMGHLNKYRPANEAAA